MKKLVNFFGSKYFRTEAIFLRKVTAFFLDLTIQRLPKTHKIYLPLVTNKIKWQHGLSIEIRHELAKQCSHLTARISESSSILDIGGNSGFYGLNIARQFPNSWVYSIEPDGAMSKVAQRVAEIENLSNYASFSKNLTPINVSSLPKVDYVVNLSVLQQWARSFGLSCAREMLQEIWGKTSKAMFFSMADTMGSPKNLQYLPDMGKNREACKDWILDNVLELDNCVIKCIDEISNPYESKLPRFLFTIERLY